jgi:hypothetical protein
MGVFQRLEAKLFLGAVPLDDALSRAAESDVT